MDKNQLKEAIAQIIAQQNYKKIEQRKQQLQYMVKHLKKIRNISLIVLAGSIVFLAAALLLRFM